LAFSLIEIVSFELENKSLFPRCKPDPIRHGNGDIPLFVSILCLWLKGTFRFLFQFFVCAVMTKICPSEELKQKAECPL